MKITFDDILSNMKGAFFNECGHNVDNISDISARFHAVASEIYSLYCNMDFTRRQSYLQTAQGEFLDYHAQLRDMQRYSASKATGELTFGIVQPIDIDIEIPSGTICSVKNEPYIQFKTDENTTLLAGTTSVTVTAVALEAGDKYNVDFGKVTVLVNAPARIEAVINNTPFAGGHLEESDESLRKRLLDSFKYLPFGINRGYLENLIMQINGVVDCKIIGNDPIIDNTQSIYIRCNGNNISDKLHNEIDDKLALFHMMAVNYNILIADSLSIDLTVDSSANQDEISSLCREYVESLKIGETLDLVALRIWLLKRLNDDVIDVKSPQSSGQYVICPSNKYIYLNSIGVVNNE